MANLLQKCDGDHKPCVMAITFEDFLYNYNADQKFCVDETKPILKV